MTVAELMKALEKCDPTLEVVMSDSEGNGYDILATLEEGMIYARGEVYKKYDGDDGVDALVLWP